MVYRNRVVVTGLGVVAPNGIGLEPFWSSLLAGRSAIGPITLFDASQHACRIAGEVRGFDPKVYLGEHFNVRRMARQTQLALAATHLALQDAALAHGRDGAPLAVPLFLGIGCQSMDVVEQGMTRLLQKGPSRVPAYTVHAGQPHNAASEIARHVPLITQATTVSSACAAGLDAVGLAAELIRRGKVELAICGGADAPIDPLTFACLAKTGLLSLRNDCPEKASRPFDLDRDSGVISEGAGVIVLESLAHARQRRATPYLELTGWASGVDPSHDEPGSGLEETMRMALANASRRALEIDHISAHGPGHPLMDRVETALIKRVFGAHAYRIPVNSIKGVIGNPLAAAGIFQLAACAGTLREDWVPPTANLEKPDPDCDLDYVPRQARRAHLRVALVNAHGIGGGNSSIIVERVLGV